MHVTVSQIDNQKILVLVHDAENFKFTLRQYDKSPLLEDLVGKREAGAEKSRVKENPKHLAQFSTTIFFLDLYLFLFDKDESTDLHTTFAT